MFKVKTVTSRESFSCEMGRNMAITLAEGLGEAPRAAWLFASARDGLQELLAGIAETVGTEALVGCTTDGEISASGFSSDSAVLTGIATDRIDFHVAAVEGLSRGSEAAGRELAGKLPDSVRYVQLFSDGLTGNGCALLRGMVSQLGQNIPICGGAAADGNRFQRTWQFRGADLLSDAAVAIGFAGEFEVGFGVQSGWSPIGIARRVTKSSKHVLYELDDQPALEVYKRFFGKHAERLPMVGIEYPLGLVESSCLLGDTDYCMLLRASVAVDHEEGSIKFAGEIPEGALVRLTCGDPRCTLEATRKAARLALADLGGRDPSLVFFFSCTARRTVLGRRTEEEAESVRLETGAAVPMVGFYTYGEFCPAKHGGPNLLHNETAVISILGF